MVEYSKDPIGPLAVNGVQLNGLMIIPVGFFLVFQESGEHRGAIAQMMAIDRDVPAGCLIV